MLLLAILALSTTSTLAQHVHVDVEMGQQVPTPDACFKIGDILTIGGRMGIIFTVTADGKHGKAFGVADYSGYQTWNLAHPSSPWRLPTRDECYQIMEVWWGEEKNDLFDKNLKAVGHIPDGIYWTINEYEPNDEEAYCIFFGDIYSAEPTKKTDQCKVRGVVTF